MWLPCKFGETIKARKYMGYDLVECRLVGLTGGIFNGGVTYTFKCGDDLFWIDLKDDIALWPLAFNNEDCYDKNSLKPVELDLLINIGDQVQYNKYFDTRKTSNGRCITIHIQDDGSFKYTFVGSDNMAVDFTADKLLVKGSSYNIIDNGQMTLL